MLFGIPSTRNRASFEQAIRSLGATPLLLTQGEARRESRMRDTACVLNRYNIDGVVLRTHSHDDLAEFARYSLSPVVNAGTDIERPCNALGDLMTIYEHSGKLEGVKLVCFGHAGAVVDSLLIGGAKMGMQVVCCCPPNHGPDQDVLHAANSFGKVVVTDDVKAAIENADVVATSSFEGDDPALKAYCVTEELLAAAGKNAIFLHPLPAYRGREVTADVIDGAQSVVYEQAENKLHIQKAVLKLLLR